MYKHKKQYTTKRNWIWYRMKQLRYPTRFLFFMAKFLKPKSARRSTNELVIWSAQMNCAGIPNWSHSGEPRLFYGIRGHEKPGIYLLDAHFNKRSFKRFNFYIITYHRTTPSPFSQNKYNTAFQKSEGLFSWYIIVRALLLLINILSYLKGEVTCNIVSRSDGYLLKYDNGTQCHFKKKILSK